MSQFSDQPSPTESRADGDSSAFDPGILVSAVTSYLLGQMPNLTGPEVAEQAGVSYELAKERWRALGFPDVADDDVSFTQADVQALRLTQKLFEFDIVEPEAQQAFIRTTGRTFARLAEWQARAFVRRSVTSQDSSDENDAPGAEDFSLSDLDELIPLTEQVQSFVWRRHLVGATSRLLLRESADSGTSPTVVGFIDIVGYTSRSRRMTAGELAEMVETFEGTVTGIVTEHHGQVIKTIGDEVLFTCDDPNEAAQVALTIIENHETDNSFPQVRAGMAHGPVLSRLGDVYGPVVNVASRLTSIARPSRIVVDRSLADALVDDEEIRMRRMRRISVKGYEHLEPWSLKRPRDPSDQKSRIRETLETTVDDAIDQASQTSRTVRRRRSDEP